MKEAIRFLIFISALGIAAGSAFSGEKNQICFTNDEDSQQEISNNAVEEQSFNTFSSNRQGLRLTNEQIKQYHSDGYLILRNVFTQRAINTISNCAERAKTQAFTLGQTKHGKIMHKGTQFVLSDDNGKTIIKRVVWIGAIEPKLLLLGRSPLITYPVAQLLNSQYADHLINQVHFKLPGDGVEFGWHTDRQNRERFDPNWKDINGHGSFVQVITAIDPNTKNNGPLRVIPGSHNMELIFDPFCKDDELPISVDIKQMIQLLLGPGDVVFIHPGLLHSSLPNESFLERKTFINGFAFPGANTKSYPGKGSGDRIKLVPNDFDFLLGEETTPR